MKALELETEVAKIIHQQELNGVGFDLPLAHKHVATLQEKGDKLYEEIRPYLDLEIEQPYKTPVNKPFLKNGGYTKSVCDWYNEEDRLLVSGPFSRIEFVEPDLGSRKRLVKQLIRHGWKPVIFTDKGFPKLTEKGQPVDTLYKIEAPVGKRIAEWYTLRHRKSQIEGWIRTIRPDGRLTAGANSCGTNTYRMKHRGVVNVPKADKKVVFGKEMRELFIARPGYKLLGYDAAQLEARCMAHYTHKFDGGEFADLVLHGDLHAKNAKIFFEEEVEGLGVDSSEFKSYRSRGKNGTYCLMYGGQPRKLASTLDVPLSIAKHLFDKFWLENEALGEVRNLVMRMHDQRGWIPGIDGRKVYTRSSHSALNALFQSCGSIIMKKSMVILRDLAASEGIHHYKVLDMHDEGQHEVLGEECYVVENDVLKHRLGDLALIAMKMAGEELNIRVEVTGDYSIGNNWAETH